MQKFQDVLLSMYKERKEDQQDRWRKEQMATRDTYLMSLQAQDDSVVHGTMISCDFNDSRDHFILILFYALADSKSTST